MRRAVVDLARLEHRAHHDRALPEPDRLERAPFEQRVVARPRAGAHVGVRAARARASSPARRTGSSSSRCAAARRRPRRPRPRSAFGRPVPPPRDLGEEAVVGCARGEQLADDRLDPRQRGALRVPVGRSRPRRSGCTNASAPSSSSKSAISSSSSGGVAASSPIQQPSASRWPSRRASANTSNVPCVAELVDLPVDRGVEVPEVPLDVLGAEQVVRERAPIREQLLRQLAQEHPVVGETLARDRLRAARRARAPPRARTRTGTGRARVDDERVAELGPRRAQARRPDPVPSASSHGSANPATGGTGSIARRRLQPRPDATGDARRRRRGGTAPASDARAGVRQLVLLDVEPEPESEDARSRPAGPPGPMPVDRVRAARRSPSRSPARSAFGLALVRLGLGQPTVGDRVGEVRLHLRRRSRRSPSAGRRLRLRRPRRSSCRTAARCAAPPHRCRAPSPPRRDRDPPPRPRPPGRPRAEPPRAPWPPRPPGPG